MFKEKLDNLKNLIVTKTDGNNKKKIENLVVFLILLIITIIAINSIWGEKKSSTKEEKDDSYKQLVEKLDQNVNSTISEDTEYNLEKRLEDILSKVAGVGKVQVLITYSRNKSGYANV